jgi:hypothetical protein
VRASAEESKLWLPKSEVKCVHAMRNAHGARADRARAVSGARRETSTVFRFGHIRHREFPLLRGLSSSTGLATGEDSNPNAARTVRRRIV